MSVQWKEAHLSLSDNIDIGEEICFDAYFSSTVSNNLVHETSQTFVSGLKDGKYELSYTTFSHNYTLPTIYGGTDQQTRHADTN